MKQSFIWIVSVATFLLVSQGELCRASGDVTANLVDGTLYVLGDGEGNAVIITGDLDSLTLMVEGDLNGSFAMEEVNAVLVNTGGGDDTIDVRGTIPEDLQISSGAGRDEVYLYTSDVLGDLSIETGQDHDLILTLGLMVTGALDISTGQGLDTIWLAAVGIEGSLSINTGVNRDWVYFNGSANVDGDLLIDFGQGDDDLSFEVWDTPILTVGGKARLHGDQGVNQVYGLDYPFTLEDVVQAAEGIEFAGF